jgi:hypothetical protein
MARRGLNLGRVRSALRRHDRGLLLVLLERALEEMSPLRARRLLAGFVPEEAFADAGPEPRLLEEVRAFVGGSLRREYYEDLPPVPWAIRIKSPGTEAFIAELDRLTRRCIAEARRPPRVSTLAAIELLLDLLRRVDEDPDSIVFFADEGGVWQLGVDWRGLLPGYFRCLADETTPEVFAQRVSRAIDDFVRIDRPWFSDAALLVARPPQRAALRRAGEVSPR